MMNVKVKVYNGVKYNFDNEKVSEIKYNNIRGYEVVTGERATFCNSHVDMFTD